MIKKLFTLLSMSLLVLLVVFPVSAQETSDKTAKTKKTNEARWEGTVIRHNSDKSTLVVRKRGSTVEKTIHYDSSTKWESQEHGSKKVNNIDASQVKEDDRVICLGTFDDKGEFHATLISKRLTKL
jgi:hypothetical protein